MLEYGYCTEFLIRLMKKKVDPETFEINTVIDALKELSGESIVAYKQDDIVKVHVHTFTPGAVLNKMQEYGEFLTVKIENMSIAHTDNQEKRENKEKVLIEASLSEDSLAMPFTIKDKVRAKAFKNILLQLMIKG